MKPIVVIGSVNTDLVVRAVRLPQPAETVLGSGFRRFPGGKGANQAVAVAKLGFPVALIAKLGTDFLGQELLSGLISAGVACDSVSFCETPTGVALIITDNGGQNSIVLASGANAELLPADIERQAALIRSAAMVLLQLEIPLATVESACRLAADSEVPVMLDPAPPDSLPRTLLQQVTWLTPNETEAGPILGRPGSVSDQQQARELAEQLLARGARNIIIKLGSRGSYLASSDGLRAFVPAVAIEPKDSTAAGDTYNAAFAVGLLRTMSPLEAARLATAAAAISVTREGAQPSMPTKEEVDALLAANDGGSNVTIIPG